MMTISFFRVLTELGYRVVMIVRTSGPATFLLTDWIPWASCSCFWSVEVETPR